MIEDILDFSKIEAGMLQVDPITIEVGQVFGDAVKAMALRAHQKGLELVYHVAPAVPEWIVADPLRLRQVLTNLLGNAIKFTERGEVSLDVDAEPLDGGDLTLHIRVKDTGIGIPRDKLEQIFAPFEQADGSTTRKYGGTGLGSDDQRPSREADAGPALGGERRGPRQHVPFHGARQSGRRRGRGSGRRDGARRAARPHHRRQRDEPLRPARDGSPLGHAADDRRRRRARRSKRSERRPSRTIRTMSCCSTATCRRSTASWSPSGSARILACARCTILMLTSAERSSDVRRCRELGLAAYLVKPVTQKELRATMMKVLSGTPAPVSPRAEANEPTSDRRAPDPAGRRQRGQPEGRRVAAVAARARGDGRADGQAAIDAYRSQTFDLILMDVQMPVLSGYDATRAIRQLERTTGTHIPIIAMTARAMKGDRERCLDAGMDDYLSKPIQGKRVMEVIRRALSPSPAPPAAPAAPAIDEAAALELVGGDDEALREVKDLCIAETPRLLDEIERALTDGRADACRPPRTR